MSSIANLKDSARPAAAAAAMVLAAAILAASPGNAEASSFQNEQRRECRQAGSNIQYSANRYAHQGSRESAALSQFLIAVAAPVIKNVVCDNDTPQAEAPVETRPRRSSGRMIYR